MTTQKTFSTIPNSSYSLKYVLIRLTSTIGNPAFPNFVTSQKAHCRSVTVGLQMPLIIAKFSDMVIARLLTATSW